MKKTLKLLMGFGVTILFVWLILQQINLREIKENFLQADWFYLFIAVAVFFLGYACRIQRWRLMLTQENPLILWSDCAGPFISSIALNNILPFRAGDLVRGVAFKAQLKTGISTTLTSLVVERLLDLLMLILFWGLAFLVFKLDDKPILGIGGGMLILTALVIGFFLLFPHIFKKPVFFGLTLVSKVVPGLSSKIKEIFLNIFNALEHISSYRMMIKLLFWSILAWGLEGCVFYIAALALPSLSQPLAAWLALPVGTLATIIPSTPGYAGTFDYFTSKAMIIMGNSENSAFIFAFIVHAILWFPPTLIGGGYFLLSKIKSTHSTLRSS